MNRIVQVLLAALVCAAPAFAQNTPSGRIVVTVADQTGGVIPGATVRVRSQEAPERAAVPAVQTSPQGVATVSGLAQGQYTIEVEFPGFETSTIRNVRVRAGETRQNVVLAISRVQDTVQVGQDPQTAASDRRGPAFGTVLTREQIDALSDDPEELRRQLQDMAGPGAVIRVDSFEGAELPHKSQIRMIRISRDAFAAENHGSGGISIDIVTQPGLGPLRGNVQMRLREGALTGRSPFVQNKGPERTQQYGMGLSGSLSPERTSFSLNVNGMTSFETPNLHAALPGGTRSEALGIRRPTENVQLNTTLDHALTVDQTLRISFNRTTNSSRNLGIGAYDLEERAYQTEREQYSTRVQHVGPLGRRFFINTRLMLNWVETATHSAIETPTIQVADAFTSGGQQLAGGARNRLVNLASDLDYVRGIHSFRTGIDLQGGWYRSDDRANYLGTYTFESLEAYEAGRPRSYTRRIGDSNIQYFNLQGAVYLQDDIRVRQNLTLSPGVRYEVQTHVRDYNNVGPRFGVTWAPSRGGSMTLRASAGVFYEWLAPTVYEQTLRVDGFRQRELIVANPDFPLADALGVSPAVNRYLLAGDVRLNRQIRFSGGLDRALSRQFRIGTTYAHMRGTALQRGLNLNVPVDGVRPDPAFANIIETVSDARSAQHTVTVFFNGTLARQTGGPPGLPVGILLPGAAGAPRIDWRRLSFSGQYGFGSMRNNADGAFSTPASGSLADEWGPGAGDVRHRLIISLNAQTIRNLTTSLNLQMTTGTPYTIRTGLDDNLDLIFNDRPAGIGRNTERGTGQMSLNGNVNYSFTFGRRDSATPPPTGVIITAAGGGAPTVQTISVPQAGRFRVGLFAQVQNLTNRANYVGYSGVLTSPFFGRPTNVMNPRRVDMGVNFGF